MVFDESLVVFIVLFSREVPIFRQGGDHVDECGPQFLRPGILLLLIPVELFPYVEDLPAQFTSLDLEVVDRLLVGVVGVAFDPLDLAQVPFNLTLASIELIAHMGHGHLPDHHRRDDDQPAQDPEMLFLEYGKCNLDLVHRITPRATEVATKRMSCRSIPTRRGRNHRARFPLLTIFRKIESAAIQDPHGR